MKRKVNLSIFYKILSILVFLIVWQLLVMFNVQHPLMFGNLPTPIKVFQAFIELLKQPDYYNHALYSCVRILIGCLLALPLGVILGMIIGLTKFGKNFIFPIFEMLRPIPQITWIPISILLFYTIEQSIIFITFIGAFFPILINTIAGTKTVNNTLIDAAKSMHASKLQIIRHVYFPSAVPNILTGLSVGVGTSWMSVIAAEMISGKYGVGYFTWMSYNLMNYADTIVGMITIGIIGILCFTLIRLLENIILAYRER